MNRERYLKTMEWLRNHEKLTKSLIFYEKLCEFLVYTTYPIFLICLLATKNEYLLRSALTCGISFILVSLLRRVLNAKRPYEVYGVPAAMYKDKKGSSTPSRHIFSATIISVSVYFVSPLLSLIVGLLALSMAVLRVLLGVHFIRDVLAGAVIGIVFGLIGSFIL